MDKKFLIWSIEHGAWWMSHHSGYTVKRELAGEYFYEEACKIIKSANINSIDTPNEAMVEV